MDDKDGADKEAPTPETEEPQLDEPESNVPDLQEQDIFEAASHATDVDHSQYMPQLKSKKKWPKIVGWTLLGLIVVAGVGVGGYMLAKHASSKPAAKTTTQTATKQSSTSTSQTSSNSSQKQSSSSASTTPTKQYTSTYLKLSFSYPDNWTVVDTGGGKLTATSPPTQLTDATGQTQTGEIVMEIANQASADMSAFKTGSATAVLPSQNIAYSNPTGTQRANTYLSFLQYATTVTHGAMDGVYITGNFGYQKGQTILESDIAKIDPLVRVVFSKCSDAKCTSATAISISSDEWSTSSFSDPIETMLKSLAFQ